MDPAISPEQLRFDSDVLPMAERFGRYRDLYAIGSNVLELGPAFSARVRGWRLDRAVLYDRHLHDVGHERPADRIGPDGFQHWTLTLLVDGVFQVDAGWGPMTIRPGELILLDMTKPTANRAPQAHIITVSVARERMAVAASDLDPLHGLIVPAEQAGLLGDYLQALARRLPAIPASCIPTVTQPIGTLLAVTLAAGGEALLLPGHADRVRQMIEARLSDPGFGPAAAVSVSGLSRATLYRLFQSQGGLALYIQRRRLNRVRVALADADDTRAFSQIAHAAGFASDSHCSRLFHETYGVRPREFRAAAVPSEAAVVGRMEYLQDEVR